MKGMKILEWTSVKERKPEIGQCCLVYTGSSILIALYEGTNKWWLDYYDRTQTMPDATFSHWMPLPDSPEEK